MNLNLLQKTLETWRSLATKSQPTACKPKMAAWLATTCSPKILGGATNQRYLEIRSGVGFQTSETRRFFPASHELHAWLRSDSHVAAPHPSRGNSRRPSPAADGALYLAQHQSTPPTFQLPENHLLKMLPCHGAPSPACCPRLHLSNCVATAPTQAAKEPSFRTLLLQLFMETKHKGTQ